MKKRHIAIIITAFIAVSFFLLAILKPFLISKNLPGIRYILDEKNRIVLYHGVNLANCSKYTQGYLPCHKKEDLEPLKRWGFNMARYLIFWHAIEPKEGEYNATYLQDTAERIRWLKELGMDVIVDLHQDLYSERFTGNGFPGWTIDDDGKRFNRRKPWNLNYLEPAVIASYTNFWKSARLKKRYIEMLEHVLSRLDTLDNIIGIDVMNEPFPGKTLNFERETLAGFYSDILRMMREKRFGTALFFEPSIFTSAGIPTGLKFRPDQGCVYSPHYYDPLCHEGRPYTKKNRKIMRWAINKKIGEARRFGTPLLFGEFGISQRVKNHMDYLDDFIKQTGKHCVGWAYYSFDRADSGGFGLLDPEGRPKDIVETLSRAYPQRIAGKNPRIFSNDSAFVLTYDACGLSAPTEIFIPDRIGSFSTNCDSGSYTFNGNLFVYKNSGKEKERIEIRW